LAQISRKELKSDEFVSGMDAAYEFYLQHQKQIITLAVAVALIAAGVYSYIAWQKSRNRAAAGLLTAALNTLHAPLAAGPNAPPPAPGVPSFPTAAARAQAATPQLQAVFQRYPSTQAGQMAHLYLGLAQLDENSPAAAATLQAAAQSSDPVVATAAQHALANYDIQHGNLAAAHALLLKLTQQDSPALPRAVALMELADLDRTYNPKEAAQYYQQLQQDYPSTQTAQQAQQQLATLKH
jgi:Tetratricopeptide repeat-like domain